MIRVVVDARQGLRNPGSQVPLAAARKTGLTNVALAFQPASRLDSCARFRQASPRTHYPRS